VILHAETNGAVASTAPSIARREVFQGEKHWIPNIGNL
jgi:hypothetical protein